MTKEDTTTEATNGTDDRNLAREMCAAMGIDFDAMNILRKDVIEAILEVSEKHDAGINEMAMVLGFLLEKTFEDATATGFMANYARKLMAITIGRAIAAGDTEALAQAGILPMELPEGAVEAHTVQ